MRPDVMAPLGGNRSLRIAVVCTDPGIPVFGCKGASVHVQEVTRALRRLGHRPELLACRTGGEAPEGLAEVPLHRLPRARDRDPAARERETRALDAALVEALVAAGPFDLVYQRYSLWSDGGMRHARDAGVPGILEVNAPLVDEQSRHRTLVDREGALACTRSALTLARQVIAVSEPVAAWARATMGLPTAGSPSVAVIPNGVDPRRFRPRSEVARAMGAPGSPARPDFQVGFVGTLKPWHGLSTLLDAFRTLAGQSPQYRLLLVGDGPERETLEARVAREGLGDRVTFTGAVAPARIPELLATLDVAVAPYPKSGTGSFYFSPLKVLEYLAAGVPVVASRVGTLEAMMTHEEHGLLVEAGSAPALARGIERLRSDPALGARVARQGRRLVESRHTWDQVVRRTLNLVARGEVVGHGVGHGHDSGRDSGRDSGQGHGLSHGQAR